MALFDKVQTELDFPAGRERHPRVLEGAAHLREVARAHRGRHAVRLLRGPAHRERPAAQRARPHARHQGPLPPLQDDAGLPRRAQGRLGHARPARRGRGREGAAHPRQGRDRGVRRRAVRRRSASTRSSATRRSGRTSPSASASGSISPSAYVTYHKSYVESVWWALSELFKKGLLYQGHKVVWWWAQGGTALIVGRGRPGLQGPSTIPASSCAFPLARRAGHRRSSSWTTTPWTLAVEHVRGGATRRSTTSVVDAATDKLIVAAALREARSRRSSKTRAARRSRRARSGTTLVGKRYVPPCELVGTKYAPPTLLARTAAGHARWRVIAADFVTLDTGTGIVHIAPAFGEDDFAAHRKLGWRGEAQPSSAP